MLILVQLLAQIKLLGFEATCISNQITLGNSSVTELRCGVSTITSFSDQRDKTNIENITVGLDFIDSLRPVEFEWNFRNLYQGDENNPKNEYKAGWFYCSRITICYDRKSK